MEKEIKSLNTNKINKKKIESDTKMENLFYFEKFRHCFPFAYKEKINVHLILSSKFKINCNKYYENNARLFEDLYGALRSYKNERMKNFIQENFNSRAIIDSHSIDIIVIEELFLNIPSLFVTNYKF